MGTNCVFCALPLSPWHGGTWPGEVSAAALHCWCPGGGGGWAPPQVEDQAVAQCWELEPARLGLPTSLPPVKSGKPTVRSVGMQMGFIC